MKKKIWEMRCALLLMCALFLTACGAGGADTQNTSQGNSQAAVVESQAESGENGSAAEGSQEAVSATLDNIPAYSGTPYVVIDNNEPDFTEDELSDQSYESYSDLDALGRCGVAESSIGKDLMPTEKRGKIGQVKPSGWQTIKFDNVDGKYLYNRCHLIGYQLTAENANEKNLITGTRYMNVDGMLPFENMVADYIKETDNHVMYRVTPVFEGDNLVAFGVLMEAESVEDHGEGIKFNVYVYNVQPGITIDYATGKAELSDTDASAGTGDTSVNASEKTYVLNENTKKFHTPECSGAKDIKEENKRSFTGSREELIKEGYSPCGRCKP